jgi:hypothetical protein
MLMPVVRSKKIILESIAGVALVLMTLGSAAPAMSSGSVHRPAAREQADLLETLTRLEKASWEAWQKRDGAYFDAFLSDDHVEVGIGGPTGKATVVAGVASPNCIVRSYEIDHFALTVFAADSALLTYHAQQDTTCRGQAVPSPAWASSLYVRRDGHWRNALYQQTQSAK